MRKKHHHIPESLLASIDQHVGRSNNSRFSAFIEAAARASIAHIDREYVKMPGDMEIINREADRLNREAEEVCRSR